MSGLAVVIAIAAIGLAGGILVGIIVARRIERMTAPRRVVEPEAGRPDGTGIPAGDPRPEAREEHP